MSPCQPLRLTENESTFNGNCEKFTGTEKLVGTEKL